MSCPKKHNFLWYCLRWTALWESTTYSYLPCSRSGI